MKTKNALLSALLVLTVALFFKGRPVLAEGAAEAKNNAIADGVYIGGINVSGMTSEEAKAAVDAYVEEIAQEDLIVRANKESASAQLEDLGIQWTNRDVAEEAVQLGKTGNLIRRYMDLTSLKYESHVYDLELAFDQTKLEDFVEEEVSVFNQEVQEPGLTRSGGKFIVKESKTGIVVNEEKTVELIAEALGEAESYRDITVDAVCEVAEPEHTTEELAAVEDVLSTYSTNYQVSNVGRTQSLELSTQRINGTVVFPGETISVSTLMGERSIEGGYGIGTGYEGTASVDMIGAGICQTASTLYCAALYCNLKVVERRNHTKIVSYVPYAMDATIYAGSDYTNPNTDLKLRNDFNYPIYIASSASGGTCTFTIYGKQEHPELKYEYISTTLEESYPSPTYIEDPSRPVGQNVQTQSAYPRVKASLTKIVKENGVEKERTVLHTDTYQASQAIYVIGTGGAVAEDPNAAGETPADPNAAGETPADPNAAGETTADPDAGGETTANPDAGGEAPQEDPNAGGEESPQE